jgi:two-component system, NtrC family, response regulator AtoC
MAASPASNNPLTNRLMDTPPDGVVFGCSEAMQQVRQKVVKVATTNVPVLIQGESGTGKEVLARLLHKLSPCGSGTFVKVNCAAIPGTLLESELFGYQKGSFTGAYTSKPGRVELAHQGTLFLDEIAEMDPGLQAKLLQLLQDGQFCRLGDQEDKKIEARVICATNRQLEKEIAGGAFRQDLFYRINVISIMLPPLRDRRDDIPILVDYFLDYYNARFQRHAPPFSREVLQLFQHRDWPGNIRELENAVARYVILGSEEAFCSEMLDKRPPTVSYQVEEDGSIPLKRIAKQAVRDMERTLILRVLQANHWNRRKTAEVLKISYRALLYKIRQAGLPPKRTHRQTENSKDSDPGQTTPAD